MKKAIPYILGLGAAFLAYKYFWKAKAAATLNIKLRTIKLQPIKNAAVVLEIINPTPASINFDSITADVLINDFALSTLNYQVRTTIPANSSVNVNLGIKINPLDGLAFIANLFKNRGKLNNIKITGTVSGEGITSSINIEQPLKF
jgi:LEA14-like dessication related protein